jgi:plasmid stabilization system protein ParE
MKEERVDRSEQAKRDVIEQAWYIAHDNVDAAERFVDACEEAFTALASMPQMGAARDFRIPKLKGLRMWPIAASRTTSFSTK